MYITLFVTDFDDSAARRNTFPSNIYLRIIPEKHLFENMDY